MLNTQEMELNPSHHKVSDYDQSFVPERIIMICLPIDQSLASESVVHYAAQNIITANDSVIFLHCRKSRDELISSFIPFGLPEVDTAKLEKAFQDKSFEILKKAVGKLKDQNIHVRGISIPGEPRMELEHKIVNLNPTFVVMGSRGMSGPQRFLLGSVSDHLVKHLRCPVM
jgi:nucleotide-binding universal stress UspA family protein